jgi:hypothetical protein
MHPCGYGPAFGFSGRALIGRLRLVGLTPTVLARALPPLPVPVRTLDCLHLATIEFIRGEGEPVELASYDNRLLAAARARKSRSRHYERLGCAGVANGEPPEGPANPRDGAVPRAKVGGQRKAQNVSS